MNSFQAVQIELVTKKAGLQGARNDGDWLVETSRQDPIVAFEVQTGLEGVEYPIDSLSNKLSTLKGDLQDALVRQQKFSETVESFDDQLQKVDDKISDLKPVSAKYTTARVQHEKFKPVFREVQQMRPVYDVILEYNEKLEKEPRIDEEQDLASKKVPDIKKRWQRIWDTVTKYHLQITTALPFEERYHYTVLRFAPWLDDAEKKLKPLQRAPTSKDDSEKLKRDIKVSIGEPRSLILMNSRGHC